jgi:hypothetical protein
MGETGTPVKIRPENEMSEYSAKTLREKMKAKARSLANPGDYYKDQEVSSADWSPAPPLKTEMKTGARPIMKPSSKGTGESYAARDTKAAIGADMKRGAFKAGGAVKKANGGSSDKKYVNIGGKKVEDTHEGKLSFAKKTFPNITEVGPNAEPIFPKAKRSGGAVKDAGVKNKAALGAIDPSPKRGAADHYKKGGKVKKNIGGVLEKISPAYAVMRSIQRGPDEEQQTKSRLQEAAMINAARGAKKGGKIKKAGGGSMLEKLVGKPKGSDYSQVGKMGTANYTQEDKGALNRALKGDDSLPEPAEAAERSGKYQNYKKGGSAKAKGGSTYGGSSPLRLMKTIGEGKKTAKIYKNPGSGEYQVKHFLDGQHQKKADYFTDDKDDAHGTADSFTSDRDARKSGGRTRAKGKTNINIVIAAGRKAGPEAPALDMAGGMPSAPANIPVPMPGPGAPPPAAMPMGGPPGMPAPGIPGMPPGRKAGGRISKIASSYKDMTAGAVSGEGRLQKTDIAKKHHGAPARKAGGKVYSSYKDMDAGAGSGPGRQEKTEIEKKQRARGK